MRFLMIVKANEQSETGGAPSPELLSAMTKYNEELAKAGVLLELAGLHPSSEGARVHFRGGKPTVVDGPFAETKELIAGFWLIQTKSKEEAIEWAKRAPAPFGADLPGVIEVRQLFEMGDFGAFEGSERAGEIQKQLAKNR